MHTMEEIKATIPDYAKDIRLNLDSVLSRSSLTPEDAAGAALAAAFAAKDKGLAAAIESTGILSASETQAARTAAALMAMTNPWYKFVDMVGDPEVKTLPAQLRMNAYQNFGGVERRKFELYALSASVVGGCKTCVSAHSETLKQDGLSPTQVRDVARIAAVINAAATVRAMNATEQELAESSV